MNKTQYFTLISEWSAKYGVPSRAFKYDPTEIRTSCVKCGKMKPRMARHHKRNDFFFALHWPDAYAARYIAFEKDDIAKLCEDCHKSIERYSKPLKELLYTEYHAMMNGSIIIPDKSIWIESWQTQFLVHYNKWLTKPIRKRRKKKRHRKVANAKF